jgi:hypothetical protein
VPLKPSCQLKFPVFGSCHIEDGPPAAAILCNSLSVNLLIIGLSLPALCLAKAGRDDSTEPYFRQAASSAAGWPSGLAPQRARDEATAIEKAVLEFRVPPRG